ncbi:VP4 [Orungo virus]|uniref:Core protein VP4 n=1 Tax=Orungo virus TaxID=40058 RepID=W5QLY4_9REOV|nr:VP4 [Orungo virus]AFX73390.1 VP4 [Orungo virus]
MEPFAVLHLSAKLAPLVREGFIPYVDLDNIKTLNDLWIEIGKCSSDVYAVGRINRWTIRQLRAYRFIFVSEKRTITLKDIKITPDVPIRCADGLDLKLLETTIGRKRLVLRKTFGDILRKYALSQSVHLHGSEAETLNMADPTIHHVKGLPMIAPNHLNPTKPWSDLDDTETDEKLVSMLDYAMYSAQEVHYVGSGDGRTIRLFAKRDKKRFDRAKWVCYDPIMTDIGLTNVIAVKHYVNTFRDMLPYLNTGDRVERLLLWDVSGDAAKHDRFWEAQRTEEDRRGESVAVSLTEYFALAIIKHRIPIYEEKYRCTTSWIVPQPGAVREMYEMRNIILLNGFSRVNRAHIPQAGVMEIEADVLREMVRNFHGAGRGRLLKKSLYESLHIHQVDGLEDSEDGARSDLFYLTNQRNVNSIQSIRRVLGNSTVSTLWVSRERVFEYDDFNFDRSALMLWHRGREHLLFDGNGAVLYLMWQHGDRYRKDVNYDPSWAEHFAVLIREPQPWRPVPDLSLCRFISLRRVSTVIRIRGDIHRKSDQVKRLGLDLSGHLFVTLISGAYLADLRWWFRMIIQWSKQRRQEKIDDLAKVNAEVVEWKEEKADEPWHRKEDLIAALIAAKSITGDQHIDGWIAELRDME